ncbi:auxin-responsive protein SAUR71-like [Vicia villosa]|uniref:auxin-responsive protein SAUR71-like n=1 Tax=Vicia villosa TaxID=3911 RepID=UPI00273BC3D0|nr:auxin-responsive protein SAUR71-like [Vicia villosa]
MGFVRKCKRVWGNKNRLHPEHSYKKQRDNTKKPPINGCVCVYVGDERQRFIIKIKIFNHPLFKTLLEDVENEYGYGKEGPLWLPCDVEFFCEALEEIEGSVDEMSFVGCNFPMSHKFSPVHNYQVLV